MLIGINMRTIIQSAFNSRRGSKIATFFMMRRMSSKFVARVSPIRLLDINE